MLEFQKLAREINNCKYVVYSVTMLLVNATNRDELVYRTRQTFVLQYRDNYCKKLKDISAMYIE